MRNDIDRRGIARLVYGEGLRRHMYDTAVEGKRVALVFAPSHRGFYKHLMFARLVRGSRAAARYGSDDFKALWIEHGNYTIPRHAPLRRAAKVLGLRLKGEHPL